MGRFVGFKLNDEEERMLAFCLKSRDGDRNVSEFFRLVLHREFRRRTSGRSKVDFKAVDSSMRIGRPSKGKEV